MIQRRLVREDRPPLGGCPGGIQHEQPREPLPEHRPHRRGRHLPGRELRLQDLPHLGHLFPTGPGELPAAGLALDLAPHPQRVTHDGLQTLRCDAAPRPVGAIGIP